MGKSTLIMSRTKYHRIILFLAIVGLNQLGQFQLLSAQSSLSGFDTSYSASKKFVSTSKSHFRPDRISDDSFSILFTALLVDKLIPHWLSTPWSFEGHTAVPREGTIACGYFVSTTLRDMGFNLNRYKFAQQLPIHEAKSLALGQPILEIISNSTMERIAMLKDTLQEGIYFIGFDQSHVGFIQKKNSEQFVIHSNYINAEGVVKERVEDSQVFGYYSTLYLTEISTNRELMKKWVTGEAISIVTQ